jgi:WD40 repeat protein
LSYARTDASSLAARLERDLSASGLDVWMDKRRLDVGASWTADVEDAIDKAHVLIALLTRGSFRSAACRAEQLRSLRKGKRVIPVLGRSGADIPLFFEEANYLDLSDESRYREQLPRLLNSIVSGDTVRALKPQFQSTYVTVPPLPRTYLELPDVIATLRRLLLTDDNGPGIALTAFHGMGGIGKTVTAQALSHDEHIQAAFPDGIVWTAVGRDEAVDLLARMQDVCRALGDEPQGAPSKLAYVNHYRTLMRRKAALVIVDDVWRVADIEPFMADSPRSRLLFTTRDTSIAAATGAVAHTAELLSFDVACSLLARYANCTPEALPREADVIVEKCGRLPLALGMAGAMLRDKPLGYWAHLAKVMNDSALARVGAALPAYPHSNMSQVIELSVDALGEIDRQRYVALAVLLEDTSVTPVIQQTLWNVPAGEGLETAERLMSRSLAQRSGIGGGFVVHDLQHDYIRQKYPQPQILADVRAALRLSANVLDRHPEQFASQLTGRLLSSRRSSEMSTFLSGIADATPVPWMRSLRGTLASPGSGLLRTFEGHLGAVRDVAMAADGSTVISASDDGTLRVWDLGTGRTLKVLSGHRGPVRAVAVTRDGRRAVSASEDRTLLVWDLSTGAIVRTLNGHLFWVADVALTPDGRRAVSVSGDGTAKLWDLVTGELLLTRLVDSLGVECVAVSQDGSRAAMGSWGCAVALWELQTGGGATLPGHTHLVEDVAFTRDGLIVSTSADRTLKVWAPEDRSVLHTLEGHRKWVTAVACTPDGRRAISASGDGTLKVWDMETYEAIRTLHGHAQEVCGVAIGSNEGPFVSASRDGTLKVWDLNAGAAEPPLESHNQRVVDVLVTRDGTGAVSIARGGTIKTWDVHTASNRRTFGTYLDDAVGATLTSDGSRVVAPSDYGRLHVCDLETGRSLVSVDRHQGLITCVVPSGEADRVVSGSTDQTVRIWDLRTGRTVHVLAGHSAPVLAAVVTPCGQRVLSASEDASLCVWELDAGRVVHTLKGHAGPVRLVAVTRDGEQAVSVSDDRTCRIWDVESGSLVDTIELPAMDIVTAVQTDVGITLLAGCGSDVLVWDVGANRRSVTLRGHTSHIAALAMTGCGRRAASVSSDRSLKLWDVSSGLLEATFTCDVEATSCRFADSRTCVVGDAQGIVHFLSLEGASLR